MTTTPSSIAERASRRVRASALAAGITLVLGACGATGPAGAPASVSAVTLRVAVFYDENGDGVLQSSETVRLPNARVASGASRATTASNGEVALSLPAGRQTLTIDDSSLPPYYSAAPLVVSLPVDGTVAWPATLAIGTNRPNTYMGVGDSTTAISGYLDDLCTQLRGYLGAGEPINEGLFGTHSEEGSHLIYDDLDRDHPAYTLILYGVNDWNEPVCQSRFPCGTLDNLRYMVQAAKARHSLPVIATIMPVNVGFNKDAPPERNDWIARMNALIRAMAAEEGAVLVDLEKAFLAEPSLRPLFLDYVHPNDEGRALMAHEFFLAITTRK